MLKFDQPVQLNEFIQPACLPRNKSFVYPPFNTQAWAVGWGRTSNQSSTSQLLNNVKLTIYNGSVYCASYGTDWSIQLCAGEYNGGKGICFGDSGGPLYVLDTINNKTKYVLAGITSFTVGNGCALNGYI